MLHRGAGWVGVVQALLLVAGLGCLPGAALALDVGIEPDFAIWDVPIGQPVSDIADNVAAIIACGTNGGPISIELKSFRDWAQCTPEATGLRELAFTYDDEMDYIARAMELEYRALSSGTSVYAHPVILSILVDDKGVVQGIRVVTDDRASDRDRRVAVVLSKNFEGRYSGWNLNCQDIPMRDGEQKVGSDFIHRLCTGTNPDGKNQRLLIEASYLRKKGQEGLSRETQQVNTGYYESKTRLEIVNAPYSLSEEP
jgi:hypothetical protein